MEVVIEATGKASSDVDYDFSGLPKKQHDLLKSDKGRQEAALIKPLALLMNDY